MGDNSNPDRHPANACHQCGREMDNFTTDDAGPGIGVCPDHSVSYGREYIGPGSIFGRGGWLRDTHDNVDDEVRERVGDLLAPV